MSMDFWNNFWTALGVIASTGISVIAIILSIKANRQTEKQIEISNKQQLFEKRIAAYRDMVTLDVSCSNLLSYQNKVTSHNISEILRSITRNEYFCKIYQVSSLKNGPENPEEVEILRKYIQILKKMIFFNDTIYFLFKDEKTVSIISDFIFAYHDLLSEIYDYYMESMPNERLVIINQRKDDLQNKYMIMKELKILLELRNSINLFN
ncbi:hypothetical protein LMK05_04005 [Lactococcus petauri]|nr:hypothetical protein LMK05_04005 [Lactococcus petauri]